MTTSSRKKPNTKQNQSKYKPKIPFFGRKSEASTSAPSGEGQQLYGTLKKNQSFSQKLSNPHSLFPSEQFHHLQQPQQQCQQQFGSLQHPVQAGSVQNINEPIYSNNVILNQQRTDKILRQTGSMISLSSVNNVKTSSPYVMYSLDPAVQYQEDSSMNPMLNFANRRVSTATSGSTQSIYSQLQFPSTSNFGSMKRKKKFDSSAKKNHQKEEANYATDSTEYSTDVTGDNIDFTEQEYTDNNVKIWSLQYVPQVFSITKKTVKV